MSDLDLPFFDFKIKESGSKPYIFDALRRKYVALTPEEHVRQYFVTFLIRIKNYPAGRIGNEISLLLNNRRRRCDTIVYDSKGDPLVIVEYKAPNIDISQEVFDQIVRYNMVLKVRYLMVTNGRQFYCCRIDYDTMECHFIREIPEYCHL